MALLSLSNLVGRDEQRQLVAKSLDYLCQRETLDSPLRVLEFYGIAGLGKSRLLDEAKEQCRQRHLPFALIGVGNHDSNATLLSNRQLLRSVALLSL